MFGLFIVCLFVQVFLSNGYIVLLQLFKSFFSFFFRHVDVFPLIFTPVFVSDHFQSISDKFVEPLDFNESLKH